ncbi:MAG: DUF481 domain-containing protein [Phycisphaerales bacterium]
MPFMRSLVVGSVIALSVSGAVASDDVTVPSAATRLDDARTRLEAARAALAEAQQAYDLARADYERSEQPADAGGGGGGDAGGGEEVPPPPTSFWSGWDGSVEAGITGSDGNSESFNFRANLSLERLTNKMETRVGLTYKYATQDGAQNANRFEANARNDWLMPDSRWRFFVQGKYEFDEFQDWDSRISGFGGVGYEFIRPEDQEPNITLIGRAGIGGSQTIGGTNETFTPEALLGLDFAWDIKEGHKFAVTSELYPSLDEFGDFRWITDVNYEILLDAESHLYLKLGIEDRYDSNPGGSAKRNDIDYYATLGWKF